MASVNGELYQGKLDIKSLRAISGQINSKLVIFVEDEFASMWINSVLSAIPDIAIDAISVHPMKGDGTAAKVHIHHNLDPSAQQESICFIDGDSEQKESLESKIFRLPGQRPESFIFDNVLENIDEISGELALSLLKPYEFESKLKELMTSVRNTNRDPHLLYAQLAKKLGFIPEARVKEAFLTVWTRINSSFVTEISTQLAYYLPKNTDETPIYSGKSPEPA